MLSFIVFTIVFFAAIFIFNRYLNNWGIENSRFRKLLLPLLERLSLLALVGLLIKSTGMQDFKE